MCSFLILLDCFHFACATHCVSLSLSIYLSFLDAKCNHEKKCSASPEHLQQCSWNHHSSLSRAGARKYNLFSRLNKKKNEWEKNNAKSEIICNVVCHCCCYSGIFFLNMFYLGSLFSFSSMTFYDRFYISCARALHLCNRVLVQTKQKKGRNDKVKTTSF